VTQLAVGGLCHHISPRCLGLIQRDVGQSQQALADDLEIVLVERRAMLGYADPP
jgi:hypothetical protein